MDGNMTSVIRVAIASSELLPGEIARQADVNPGQLSRFIANKRSLTLPAVERICDVLGLVLRPGTRRPKREGKQ
jgi:plasmid maintenance system antidote protein VapI